jgi:branched-chain amino acid transport system substrate-binding protein
VSHLDRRQVLKIFGVLATAGVTGAAAGCGSGDGSGLEQPSGRRIKVGLIAPAIGPYASVGKDITQGFRLYLDTHRNLLGRHAVDLFIEDEGGTAASARAAVDALLKQGVVTIAGVANPMALTAIRDEIEKAKIPLVSANASPSSLASVYYIWRVSYVDGEAGRALAPYAAAKYQRAYLLYEDTPTARDEAGEFRKGFTDLGGTIQADVRGTGTFDQRLNAARFSGADVIFAAYAGEQAWQLLTAYRDARLSIPMIGPGSLTETSRLATLVEKGGRVPNHVLTAMNYAPDLDNDANRRFASTYFNAYGTQPTAYAMQAYDSAAVLDSALRLVAGQPAPAALNRAFSDLGQFESPRGNWAFNVNGTPQQKWYLRELRLDGQLPANLVSTDLDTLA